MKRFYDTVTVEAIGDDGAFRINLDGRPIKTPARRELLVPSGALADAIADEWRAQEETVVPASMPLTRLASGAIDRIAGRREPVIDEVAAYAETDLLCYRADHPAALAKRQHDIWQPILDWIEQRHHAAFVMTAGVIPVTQPTKVLGAIKAAIGANDDMTLAALHAVTHATGSVVLAMALIEGHIDAAALVAASQLDEQFQSEQWGEDAEATERRAALAEEIHASARFVALLSKPC